MAADNTDGSFGAPAGGRGRAMQLAIIAILMVGEGVGVFFIANALHDSPDSALAGDVDAVEAAAATPGPGDLVEVEMAECRPGNSSSGKFITLQIKVSALVGSDDEELAKGLAKDKRARIRDRVNYVIRSAQINHLNEPGLETIKRRLRHELDLLLEVEGLIKEIVIPEFLR